MSALTAALAGNPNCGKTTLFNALTGGSLYVGNWPGVTVEKRIGRVRGEHPMTVVDLPGAYSLRPASLEEQVTRDYLTVSEPDVIINVLDGAALARSLYLTLQLLELGRPLVLAVNMMDEAGARGIEIDCAELEKALGVRCVPCSAKTGAGLAKLLRAAESAACGPAPRPLAYGGAPDEAIRALLRATAGQGPAPARRAAAALEGDPWAEPALGSRELSAVRRIRSSFARGRDPLVLLAAARYRLIDRLTARAVKCTPPAGNVTACLDKILMHPVLALPIFFCAMLAVLTLSFGWPGGALKTLIERALDVLSGAATTALTATGAPAWLPKVISEAVIGGAGAVLSFAPQMGLLFMFLCIMEDSGYMARAAFMTDGLLRGFGLSGRSFIPMLLGFGCSVPAVMAARGLGSERERRFTVRLIPLMSCGAKLPVYGLFAGIFFPGREAAAILALYLTGLLFAAGAALLLRKTKYGAASSGLVMELPPYRFPGLLTLSRHVWERLRAFMLRAGGTVAGVSALVWLLGYITPSFSAAETPSESLLAELGRLIAPLFSPLGFGNWQSAAALFAGAAAKESAASVLIMLMGRERIAESFDAVSACSFLIFVLLYTPCAAALAAIRRELGLRAAILQALLQTALAWSAAFAFYQLARMYALLL